MPPLAMSEAGVETTATSMGGRKESSGRLGRSTSTSTSRPRGTARSISPKPGGGGGVGGGGRRPAMNRSRSSNQLNLGGSAHSSAADSRKEARHARAALSRSRSFKRQISGGGIGLGPPPTALHSSKSLASLSRGGGGGGNGGGGNGSGRSNRTVSDPTKVGGNHSNFQWSTTSQHCAGSAGTTASVSNRMRRRSRSPMKTIQMKSPARPNSVQNFMRRSPSSDTAQGVAGGPPQQGGGGTRLMHHQDPFASLLTEDSLGNSTATGASSRSHTWMHAGMQGGGVQGGGLRKLGKIRGGAGDDVRDDCSGHSDDSDGNISIKMSEFIGSSAINHTGTGGGGSVSPAGRSPNTSPGRSGLGGGRAGSRRNLLAATKGSVPAPTNTLSDDSLLDDSSNEEQGGASPMGNGSRRNLLGAMKGMGMESSFRGGNMSFRGKITLDDLDDDDDNISLDMGDGSKKDNFEKYIAESRDNSNRNNADDDDDGTAVPCSQQNQLVKEADLVQLKLEASHHGGPFLMTDVSQQSNLPLELLQQKLQDFNLDTFERNVHFIQDNAPELNCFTDTCIKNVSFLRREAKPFCAERSSLFSKNLHFLKEKLGLL